VSREPTREQWRTMANRLCGAMRLINDDDTRLSVLKAMVNRLGTDAYPALIKLLTIVAESSDADAKRRLAQTLGFAAQRSDLPKGELNAWGLTQYIGSGLTSESTPVNAGSFLRSYLAGSATRGLGPIEYLIVWYSQKTQRPYLGEAVFMDSLVKLIKLINVDPQAARIYANAILMDLDSRTEGAFTRLTQLRLTDTARAWLGGSVPEDIARAALQV
jgi:hypothetical protein